MDHKCALICCQQLQLDDEITSVTGWLVISFVNNKRINRATPKLYAGTTVVIKSIIPVQHEMTRVAIYRSAVWFSRGGVDVDEQEKKVRLGAWGWAGDV